MIEIDRQTKQYHMRNPDGGTLCNARMENFMTICSDVNLVSCEKCLQKIANRNKEAEDDQV